MSSVQRIIERLVSNQPPYIRDLILESGIVQDRTTTEATSPVFHYTSADGFHKIVDSGSIWLSNTAFLNDPSELSHPVALARDELQEVYNDNNDPMTKDFLAKLASTLSTHTDFKLWYVASFSQEGNLLSQWRAYCPNGGYSLGFDPSMLAKLLRGHSDLNFGPVIYSEQEQRATVRRVVNRYLEVRRSVREKHPEVDHTNYDFEVRKLLTVALCQELIFFKVPVFLEEKEWRVIRYGGSGVPRFRVRNGSLIPYSELNLTENGRLPFHRIYVSPLGENELSVFAAKLLLESKGYQGDILCCSGYQLRS